MSSLLVLEVPRTSQAPGIARRWLAESYAQDLDHHAQETAKLLVSELVTNAVTHGHGRVEIHAQLDRDRLLVAVIDEGPGFTPTIRERDPDIPGGRGLRIVDAEASRWGIREAAADVWFELPRHPAR
jgi:anti-sigma regulatory factor (Ser/Thr protein kinase)